MNLVIEIEKYQQDYYHALDAVVKDGDILKIKTNISNVTFTVVIDNKDGFFASSGKLITKEVTQNGGEITIGTVNSEGASVKEYGIYDNSGSIPGVDPEAPPRIVRVQ